MRKIQRKPRHAVLAILLVVGEGADDRAFIAHMKQLFCPRGSGLKVQVEAGDGGSAGNIISNSIRSYRGAAYDRRILLLDADLPPTEAERKRAEQAGYEIILWQPQCLEGVLLEALDEPVRAHETSQQLKQRLHPRLAGKHTDPAAYAELFTADLLQKASNPALSQLNRALLNQPDE
ncbi:hypothetical protein V2S84_14530 [Azotobacter chroococcum]|nr:hypothetical protein [Azotobacter chroococcum]